MIRDVIRALLAVTVMAIGAAIVVDAYSRLAAIDVARQAALNAVPRQQAAPAQWQPAPAPQPAEGGVRRFGRAAIDMADAFIGLVR
jgi:hypothetical protein